MSSFDVIQRLDLQIAEFDLVAFSFEPDESVWRAAFGVLRCHCSVDPECEGFTFGFDFEGSTVLVRD